MSPRPQTRDRKGRPLVAVTGIGIVTSLGAGQAENWTKLTAGQSGLREITRFPTDGLKTRVAGTIDFVQPLPENPPAFAEHLAALAIDEALAESGVGAKADFPGPLYLAIMPIEMVWDDRLKLAAAARSNVEPRYPDLLRTAAKGAHSGLAARYAFRSVADALADRYGTKGSPISVQTACASGATAIQLGIEAIRRGDANAALCVGVESSISMDTLVRFSLLSALSTQNEPAHAASKPFSKDRDGFVMAEAAGALVLEDYDHAMGRGATILGIMSGSGEMADSFHRTRSSPDGKAIIGSIRNALDDAALDPDEIGYINAHGTGTPENDKMEYLGIATVFGDRAGMIPVSSNKSMIGHTMSAAGIVEAIFTLLTLRHGRIPPTINYAVPDPAIPLDVVPNVARDADVRHALSNSFGFGGQNASLVISREPT